MSEVYRKLLDSWYEGVSTQPLCDDMERLRPKINEFYRNLYRYAELKYKNNDEKLEL